MSADLKADIAKQSGSFAGKQGAGFGNAQPPQLIAAKIINSLLGLLGTVALVYVIYAGYLIMTAGGNEEQVTKGKNVLKNGVIGLAIILSAYGLTKLAVRFATGNQAQQGSYCTIEQDGGNPDDPLGTGKINSAIPGCEDY